MSEENVEFQGFLSINQKNDLIPQDDRKTGPLKILQAKTIVENHLNNTNPTGQTIPAKLEDSKHEALNGYYFSFEGNDLRLLLSNTDIIGVYAAIAKNTASNSGYTIVLYGVTHEEGNNLTLHLKDDEIFDYCDPCPPKCPISLS